ncbi:hypothetical protein ACIKTA_00560 [Hansschlegelia beijingensis]|uniref:hypothetical protein n=1 Tax=Hansschlegelia beijingensis TaxID=1133344 RepID=UPI0037FBADE0
MYTAAAAIETMEAVANEDLDLVVLSGDGDCSDLSSNDLYLSRSRDARGRLKNANNQKVARRHAITTVRSQVRFVCRRPQ